MISAVAQTCIVLAGGLGTRLRSAVADLPKCLAPVGARPFIELQIDRLKYLGIGDIVLSLGYMAEKVVDVVGQGGDREGVRFIIERELLGTGGAILHVMNVLGVDEVLVANGDTYLDGELGAMLRPLDLAAGELMRMALVGVNDRQRFGGVELGDAGRILGFLEKGQLGAGLINAGLYRLHRKIFAGAPVGAFSLESDILPDKVKDGAVNGCLISGTFTDIGVPEDYYDFCVRHA